MFKSDVARTANAQILGAEGAPNMIGLDLLPEDLAVAMLTMADGMAESQCRTPDCDACRAVRRVWWTLVHSMPRVAAETMLATMREEGVPLPAYERAVITS